MTALVADAGWRAEARDEGLVLHAGADQNYLVPGIAAADARPIATLFGAAGPGQLDPAELPAGARAVLPQIRALGALRPACLPQPDRPRAIPVAIRVLGATPVALMRSLERRFSPVGGTGLTLVVRTSATLRDLSDAAADLASGGPYLLLDLAYHHTIALGPLVVPGQSACVGCLAARAGVRWGDPRPPATPRATGRADLATALAGHAVDEIGRGSLTLLERVVAFDLEGFTTTAEHVLPAADCPVCPGLEAGRITLPWEEPA